MLPIKNSKWKNIISVTIVFALLILLIEILPRVFDLAENIYEWYSQSTVLDSAEEHNMELQQVKSVNTEIKNMISAVVSDYEENRNISSVIKLLNDAVSRSGVKLQSIKPDEIKKEDNLWLQDIRLELISNYEQLFNFVHFVEASAKVILIKDIRVVPEKISKSSLESVINISVYLNL